MAERFVRLTLICGFWLLVSCDQPQPVTEAASAMPTAPYGTWESPITAAVAASSSRSILAVEANGDDLYWLESRPLEGGRYVIVRRDTTGNKQDVIQAPFSSRTRVHEYGGGSFLVADDTVFFSNFPDQGLYIQERDTELRRLSQNDDLRYADCEHDGERSRLICVREDHRAPGEARNAIVAMDLRSERTDGTVLWDKTDFVAYPRLNSDSTQLAWLSWHHPNMPWDNVELWVADIDSDGDLKNPRQLNVGAEESVLQPAWADDGTLYFLSDRSGWWNLHRWDGDEVAAVHRTSAELGGPLWSLGESFFALISSQAALVRFHNANGEQIGVLKLDDGELTAINLPFVSYRSLLVQGERAYFVGGRDDAPSAIVELHLETKKYRIVHEAGKKFVDERYLSRGEPIEFPTENGLTAYAYYYPPVNGDFTPSVGEWPPLMVLMHGGPTGETDPSFSVAKQFWTSRGIAVLDVNYRGSSGYGRKYRQQLNGRWGIVDVEDAVAATRYAVDKGLADPNRLLIRGGSAGGFTTLAALAFRDVFAAGANYFGVSDLEALAKHTHKFESRYLDSMVGPYPERADLYRERSPINALDGFTSPLITFQGLEDRVVPPEQSEMIYEALKAKGIPTAYVPFQGEQHGFRKSETIVAALEAELYFYGKVLGFEPAGELTPVHIDNLVE